MNRALVWVESKTEGKLNHVLQKVENDFAEDDNVYDFKITNLKDREIQWVAVEQSEELKDKVQKMIQFMTFAQEEIVTFFLNYDDNGYMVEAYDNFEWFEVTSKSRYEDE